MKVGRDRSAAGRATRLCVWAGMLPVAAAGLLLAGASRAHGRADGPPPDAPLACRARAGVFVQVVRARGSLAAQEVIAVQCPLSDRFITSMVPEGSRVKKGDVIMELDRAEIEKQILDVKSQVTASEASVTAARARFERTRLEIETTIEELEARVRVAEARLRQEEAKPLPERRRAAEARLAEADARCTYAQYWLSLSEELNEEGILSDSDVRRARLDSQTAEADRDQARRALDEALKGAKPEDLEGARAGVASARIALREAQESRQDRLSLAEAQVQTAENGLDQLRTRLSQLDEDLGRTRIVAERDGAVFPHGDVVFKVGDPVWHGLPVADLADTARPVLQARVRECDSQLVAEGQAAEVHLLAMQGRPLAGKVSKVAAALADEQGAPDMRFLEVEVRLDEAPPGLRPGMKGYADIQVRSLPDVVIVPASALADGVVTVVGPAGREARRVEVLATDGTQAAIGSGLSEGEWVRLCPEE